MFNFILDAYNAIVACFRRQLDTEIERVIAQHDAAHQSPHDSTPVFIINNTGGSSSSVGNSPVLHRYSHLTPDHASGHPRLTRRHGVSDFKDLEAIRQSISPKSGL